MEAPEDYSVLISEHVVYIPNHAHGNKEHRDCERGIITSANETGAFVRYGAEINSKLTYWRNLEVE